MKNCKKSPLHLAFAKVSANFLGMSLMLVGLTACGGGGTNSDPNNEPIVVDPAVVAEVPKSPPTPVVREYSPETLSVRYKVKKEENVRYAEGEFGLLDVWSVNKEESVPSTAPLLSPIVVVIHGGAWAFGDKSEEPYDELSRGLSAQGFLVFNANYVLSPTCDPASCAQGSQRAPYPAQLNSTQQIMKWVYENAERLGGDKQKISLIGLSAGGHIALDYAVNTPSGPAINCIGSMSAPLDLLGQNGYPAYIRQLLGYFVPTQEKRVAASVLQKLSGLKNVKTVWLFHGDADELIPFDEATKAKEALLKSSIQAIWTSFAKGVGHENIVIPSAINIAVGWFRQECQ